MPGYACLVSQSTREYGRHFGSAPTKDIAMLLQNVEAEVPVP